MQSAHGEPIVAASSWARICCAARPGPRPFGIRYARSKALLRFGGRLDPVSVSTCFVMTSPVSAQPMKRRVPGGGEAAVEWSVVVPDGPSDASDLVGQGDGGLVVADPLFQVERPALQAGECVGFALGDAFGLQQGRPSPVDEHFLDADIPAVGDAAEVASMAAGGFAGRPWFAARSWRAAGRWRRCACPAPGLRQWRAATPFNRISA